MIRSPGDAHHQKQLVKSQQQFFTVCYICLQARQKGDHTMQTINPDGQFNNYAVEPQMYYAQYPNPEQQQRYVLQGAISALFVTALFLITFGIS